MTDDTYDIILARCRKEIEEGEIRHLLVLLGVPIAYPRLVWLENILTSKAMTPVKALGRAGVFRGGFLNKFDGGVEVLDDLDDHWTATGHKEERYDLILDLQELAAEKSIRITILGGDVHLAGVGQFYSNPKLRIPKDRDHRYIPNVISSAIVNTPPPEMLADTLNKRNKIHHFDRYTIEDMIPMFTHDVDGKKRNNKRLLPRRNWCSIREYRPGSTPPPTPPESLTPTDKMSQAGDYSRRRFSFSREDANPRKLFRRLSNRGAPPSSYRDSMNITSPTNARPASHDGYFPNAEPQTAPATRTSFSMSNNPVIPQTAPASRTSFTSTASYNHRASIDALPSAPNPRPGIFRRPTNLSEKAARKGGSLTDSQGNLIDADLSDHINLEGGLDITLNCEVNQGDPAGITTPYRLLIPALRYDGSSDDQKLDSGDVSGVQRKPTLLKKLGFGRTGNRSTADRQGQGNWGQGSESESEVINQDQYSDEDDDQPNYYEKPEKRSSSLKRWFSGRKGNKQDHPYSPSNYEQPGSQMYSQQQQSPQSQKGAGAEDEFAGRELRATPPQTQQQQLAAPPTTIPTQTAPIPPSRSTTTAGSSSGDKLTTYHQPSSNLQPPPRRQPPDPDPEIESFPHHPRGKAAQMLGVGIDQGPGTHHHPPPLSAPLPQQLRPRSSSTHTPTTSSPLIQGWTPTTVGGGGGGGAGSTSLNASQPLPPPSSAGNGSGGFKAKPSLLASAAFGEDVGVAGGKGKGGWANYDLSRPLPMSAGGQGQQGQVVRGYEGLDAYPGRKVEKKQRRGSLSAAGGAAFKRWFS